MIISLEIQIVLSTIYSVLMFFFRFVVHLRPIVRLLNRALRNSYNCFSDIGEWAYIAQLAMLLLQ